LFGSLSALSSRMLECEEVKTLFEHIRLKKNVGVRANPTEILDCKTINALAARDVTTIEA